MRAILPAALALLAGCAGVAAPAEPDGEATAVRLARAPEAGGEACWSVEGTGRIARTELRWDDESHAKSASRAPDDYDGGAVLPGNTDRPSADGYALPGYFCARVPAPEDGSRYVVADAGGRLSDEAVVRPSAP